MSARHSRDIRYGSAVVPHHVNGGWAKVGGGQILDQTEARDYAKTLADVIDRGRVGNMPFSQIHEVES